MDVSGIVQEDLRRIREHSEKFLGRYDSDGDYNPTHLREIARLATRDAEAVEECRRRGDFSRWPERACTCPGALTLEDGEEAVAVGVGRDGWRNLPRWNPFRLIWAVLDLWLPAR